MALPEVALTRKNGPSPLALLGALIGLGFSGPFLYVLSRNLELGGDLGALIFSDRTWGPLRRSLELGVLVAGSSAVVGTALAWLLVRTDLPGRRLGQILAPLPLVFPSFVGATALISGFARGGLLESLTGSLGLGQLPELKGLWAAWLVLTLFTYPYVYLPVAARMKRLAPSLEESAQLLGRGRWRVFTTIVMPQLRTAISAGALIVFLYTISDYGAVQLLRYDTLTRVIFENQLTNPSRSFALSLLLGVVALVVVLAERALLQRDPPRRARGDRPIVPLPLGRLRIPATVGVAVFLLGAIAGPAASLLHWTVRGWSSTRTSGALAVDSDGLLGGITNTVMVGLASAALTVMVVLPIAYLVVRRRSRVGSVADLFVVGGFALPGLVTALAIVFWVLRTPLLASWYQTLPILLLAYVLHFGAQASRASQVALGAVPPRLEDAARLLGAGRWRRLATIELPLMARGLLAAGGLVLLSTMKELPATLILAPIGFDTMATRIWASMETVSYAQAGLDSLLLLAVSAVLTWLLVIRGADRLD